jgi:hypothetical protein
MKNEKPISVRTQQRLAQNICDAVNKLVDYQSRLHFAVLQPAVNLQIEANRLRFMLTQIERGEYRALEPPVLRKPKLDGGVDRRRGFKGHRAKKVPQ